MLLIEPTPTVDDFEAATGWKIEPRGACRGSMCVPLPDGAVTDGRVDPGPVAERLGMGLVRDEQSGLTAVGPATLGGRALTDVACPDLELPDLDGNPFSLSSLRGTNVVLVAWAPY